MVAGFAAGTLTVGIPGAAGLLATPGCVTGTLATGGVAGFADTGGWAAGACAVVPGLIAVIGAVAGGADPVAAGAIAGFAAGFVAGWTGAATGGAESLCSRRQISRNVVRPLSITSSPVDACATCMPLTADPLDRVPCGVKTRSASWLAAAASPRARSRFASDASNVAGLAVPRSFKRSASLAILSPGADGCGMPVDADCAAAALPVAKSWEPTTHEPAIADRARTQTARTEVIARNLFMQHTKSCTKISFLSSLL